MIGWKGGRFGGRRGGTSHMALYYTGVGSRETWPDVLILMSRLAERFSELKWILRSGGADGADIAFEEGADNGMADIYLPSKGWNAANRPKNKYHKEYIGPTPEAMKLTAQIHPAWQYCSPFARLLLARDLHQVLGLDLKTPSVLVVCWTADGAQVEKECSIGTGGTAMAIRVASRNNIPVFNLRREGALEALGVKVKSIMGGG